VNQTLKRHERPRNPNSVVHLVRVFKSIGRGSRGPRGGGNYRCVRTFASAATAAAAAAAAAATATAVEDERGAIKPRTAERESHHHPEVTVLALTVRLYLRSVPARGGQVAC
jgi:hypothetical protein